MPDPTGFNAIFVPDGRVMTADEIQDVLSRETVIQEIKKLKDASPGFLSGEWGTVPAGAGGTETVITCRIRMLGEEGILIARQTQNPAIKWNRTME